ncbi:hypothetical protein VIGAN_03180100 [Vigna angularis var. angularis]|uniref:Uncharacterized protein n=1 Tax=Vigna angularis var. angularis TaxID=157739 RepID=A0A0S3RMT6_PHAAN|nr:hypothetical protein VIGAN_03180100 [Vigna angularis var. angularis]
MVIRVDEPSKYGVVVMEENFSEFQGFGNITIEGTAFGFSNSDQQLSGSRLSTAVTPKQFPGRRKPFRMI